MVDPNQAYIKFKTTPEDLDVTVIHKTPLKKQVEIMNKALNLPETYECYVSNTIVPQISLHKPVEFTPEGSKLRKSYEQQVQSVQKECEYLSLRLQEKENEILQIQKQGDTMEKKYKAEIQKLQGKLDKIEQVDNLQTQVVILDRNIKQFERISRYRELNNHEYEYRLSKYDNIMTHQVGELREVASEVKTVRDHVDNIGVAFLDVSKKYAANKAFIDTAQAKQEGMEAELSSLIHTRDENEENYAHEKCTKEAELNGLFNEMQEIETKSTKIIKNLKTKAKRLKIKEASVEETLHQKEAECSKLSTLVDDISTKKKI